VGERTETGGDNGSRSFALVDWYTAADHSSHLGLRRVPLNDRCRPIHRAEAREQVGVQVKDLERFFSMQREAVDAAIRSANDSGKEGKPGVVPVQKSKTEFEKIWTYGESSYPPTKSDLAMMSVRPEPRKLAGDPGLGGTLASAKVFQFLYFVYEGEERTGRLSTSGAYAAPVISLLTCAG
jgi:hypothetical protein